MLNQLFIIHQRSAFIIHYSPKILSNEWWILNNEKWIIQNENPADKNRQDFRFGGSGWILCAPWFFDRSERLRKIGVARDFTVPKAYRGFWAASTEPPSALLILYFLTKTKNQSIRTGSLFWWERVDSNHRSRRQQIYSLPPLATREHSHI